MYKVSPNESEVVILSNEYLVLNGDYSVFGDSVCDVSDDYIVNLRYCPLAELGTEDSLICSSACLYYSDCKL